MRIPDPLHQFFALDRPAEQVTLHCVATPTTQEIGLRFGFPIGETQSLGAGLSVEQTETTIVHGDYRLDNVIYSPLGEVAAVVDWELCTLGDPLADLGLLMVYWAEPEDGSIPLLRPATVEPGFPSRAELAAHYAAVSGRDISKLDYFVALGYWKLAVILEGVLARFRNGQYGEQARAGGEEFASAVEQLAEAASEAIGRYEG